MLFLNSWEIDDLFSLYGENRDNIGKAVRLLTSVRNDANSNSDGWAHWPKPARACKQLIELLNQHVPQLRRAPLNSRDVSNPTDAELRRAIAPIRAFYTKQGGVGATYPAFPDGEFPEQIRACTRRLLRSVS